MKKIIVVSVLFLLSSACQQKPTQTSTQLPVMIESKGAQGKKSLEQILAEHPVMLDTRSSFDFNLGHVPGSINIRWEDFSQKDPHSRGLLEPDLFSLARRLSLIGIDPETPVVVLGKVLDGEGEDGRIAWTLQVLGVKKVAVMSYNSLRSLRDQESPPVKNQPYWKPAVDESLTVDFKFFKNMVTGQIPVQAYPSKARQKALQIPPHAIMAMSNGQIFGMTLDSAYQKLVVLDVRSPEQFSIENLKQKKDVKVPVVNIEWKKLFNAQGFVVAEAKELLKSKGINEDSVVFVISNHGVRSAAATFALRSLGYLRSSNFAGGYEQWNVNK